MKNKKPLLEIKNLSIWREKPILKNLNFKIFKGEHWAILGPNGSGKSSLLAALTAYLSPSQGEMEILNCRYGASDWRELRKKIGIVSSAVSSILHEAEVVENLVLSGKEAILNYWGKIEEKDLKQVHRLLKQMGCAHLAKQSWGTLSQGERQRVFIARALMAQYQILIFDEACAGLDLVAREDFIQRVGSIAESRKSPLILWVTHHIEEIAPWITHVMLLKEGEIFAQGLKEKILNSKNLSEIFDRSIKVYRKEEEYRWELLTQKSPLQN